MNQNQKSKNEELNSGLGELHPKEIDLIRRIRTKYRFGEVMVKTRDGLPFAIHKTVVYENLGEKE